jgi:signal transduction histidine kinase
MGHALDDLSSSHAVAVVEDITAQEAAKRLIVNFKTELEREIKLKTRQLRDANIRLAKLSRQTLSVQEAERARVARDLHDGIGQSLTAMKVYIDNMMHNADAETATAWREEIAWLGERVCDAISETRRVAMNLRPAILDDLGLAPALSWFLREYQQSLRNVVVKAHISIDEGCLNEEQKTAVFRIVQEALGNCAKYADATRVGVQLAPVDGRIRLEIDDNGKGFDLVNVSRRSRGHGLDNMRQRAAMTGGNLRLTTEPGDGVTIIADWPKPGAEPPGIDSRSDQAVADCEGGQL